MKEYNLEKDHEAIKKQIKGWENQLDKVVGWILDARDMDDTLDTQEIADLLENMSQEMMSINI